MLTVMLQNLFTVDKRTKKGKAFTRMIATVNPSADPLQVSHTKSTMTYASTVKSIKIAAPQGTKIEDQVKVLPEQVIAELKAKVASLEARNQDLEIELLKYKAEEMPLPAEEASTGKKCDDAEIENLKSKLETKTRETQKLTHDLESQKQSLQEAMDSAHDDLLEQKKELGLCNTLLGSADASRTVLEEQNQQLLDNETSQLQAMDSLKSQLAECTNKGQQHEQTLAIQEKQERQKQQQACELLSITSALNEEWEGKSKLEIVLHEVAELNVKQAERKELLEQLHEQRIKAGKVTFSAWLGQLVSDLSADGEELGPVQKRLLKVDKAIEMVK
jgi:chromosome segregation ATPase